MSQRLIDATIAEAEKDDRLGSDPDTKFAIAPIIIALVPVVVDLIKKCSEKNPERAARLAQSPGLLRRWKLRGEIEKLVPGDDKESREVREHLFQSVLVAGKTATAADFEDVGAVAA